MSWVGTVPATSWPAALPGLLVCALVLWGPGAVLARLAGARGLVVPAVAPVLTAGVVASLVALQSLVTAVLGHSSGLLAGRTAAAACVLAAVVTLVVRRLAGWRSVPDRSAAARPRGRRWDAVPVVVSCLVSTATFVLATGRAGAVEQSNDSPFHLLAIARVASLGDGSWQQVRATTGHAGFYPPLFDDLAALVVRAAHVDVVTAAGILLALLVGVVWPLGVDALVRTVLTAAQPRAPRRVGRAAAMALVPATAAFPAQLVQFGALWPNLLGIALAPAVLAALVDLTHPAGRVGERASLWTPTLDWLVLGLGALALALAHPDALLSLLVAGSGLVLAGTTRFARRVWAGGRRPAVLAGAGGAVLIAAAVLALALRSGVVAGLVAFDAARPWSIPTALHKVLLLDVVATTWPALAGVAALVGVVVCLRRRRHRWLVVGWALSALQVVLAGSMDGTLTGLLTGLWYSEPARLSSALVVTTLPLAAVGAAGVVDGVSRVSSQSLRRGVAGALVAAAAGWVAVGVHDVYRIERDTYRGLGPDRTLVTPAEAALYARVLRPDGGRGPRAEHPAPAEAAPAVVGDPFGGAMFAALFSGRPTPVAHFGQNLAGSTGVVARSFRTLGTDPAVCAAVADLGIGYAVEDTARVWSNDARFASYAGLRGLAAADGLELVAREGTVSVYRVRPCGRPAGG